MSATTNPLQHRGQAEHTRLRFSRIALAVVAGLSGAQALQAQDPSLDEVLVTGTRIQASGMTTPTPVHVRNRRRAPVDGARYARRGHGPTPAVLRQHHDGEHGRLLHDARRR